MQYELEFGTRKAELVWLIRTGLAVGTREAMFGVAGAYRARGPLTITPSRAEFYRDETRVTLKYSIPRGFGK